LRRDSPVPVLGISTLADKKTTPSQDMH
jgi:hypothetical protein